MTCASCAAHVEKRLNELDGVTAAVNYATEQASVTYDPARLGPGGRVRGVEETGYGASPLPSPGMAAPDGGQSGVAGLDPAEAAAEARLVSLRTRLIGSAILAVPVVLLSMIPALQFRNW